MNNRFTQVEVYVKKIQKKKTILLLVHIEMMALLGV